jgi:hypothetical protein
MLDEERVEALRARVRERAAEQRTSLFEAATELCHETWDNDEEELLQRWRLELAPRKRSRNPVKRMRTYLAHHQCVHTTSPTGAGPQALADHAGAFQCRRIGS